MPRVKKIGGGRVYVRRVDQRFSAGDEADVSEAGAEYLLEERDDFALVDAGDEEADSDDDQADDAGDDGFDATAFLDRTPVDDVVDDIEAGEADDHLDAVAEAAERVTVEDAVGQRRAELAEEE